MENFEKRMLEEYDELEERIDKLENFLFKNVLFKEMVEGHELYLMKKQLQAMQLYKHFLGIRCTSRNLFEEQKEGE